MWTPLHMFLMFAVNPLPTRESATSDWILPSTYCSIDDAIADREDAVALDVAQKLLWPTNGHNCTVLTGQDEGAIPACTAPNHFWADEAGLYQTL